VNEACHNHWRDPTCVPAILNHRIRYEKSVSFLCVCACVRACACVSVFCLCSIVLRTHRPTPRTWQMEQNSQCTYNVISRHVHNHCCCKKAINITYLCVCARACACACARTRGSVHARVVLASVLFAARRMCVSTQLTASKCYTRQLYTQKPVKELIFMLELSSYSIEKTVCNHPVAPVHNKLFTRG
jgi:hypothetical protein